MKTQLDFACLRSLENAHTEIHQAIQNLKDGDKKQTKEKVKLAIEKALNAIIYL